LSLGAKVSLTDLAPLQNDIDNMASAVVQVYKTLTDHLNGAYPHFSAKEGRRIFPVVVTLENWRLFGPVMMDKLAEAAKSKLSDASLSPDLIEKMPYSIWAIEDLEIGLQIMHSDGIAPFMDGKLKSAEMRQWDWRGYIVDRYPKFTARKLFDKEYDEMFAEVHAAPKLAS
jgi:hypothetical protein